MKQHSSEISKFQPEVRYRNLLEGDLGCVQVLVQQAGWNQLYADWLRVLNYEPGGCFAALSGDRLVGTVTSTAYGNELGWIGMMLVHSDFRRRGIATELMCRSISYLKKEKEVKCIKLDATPVGQSVYAQLGFVDDWSFHRWELASERQQQPIVPNVQVSRSITLLADLDRAAFGVDRTRWLISLTEASELVATQTGFGMIRSGRIASYLGPLVASTTDSAEQLVRSLLKRTGGRVFWDIPGPNLAAQSLAKQFGFQPVRQLTRMSLGKMHFVPDMLLQYAIAGPETG